MLIFLTENTYIKSEYVFYSHNDVILPYIGKTCNMYLQVFLLFQREDRRPLFITLKRTHSPRSLPSRQSCSDSYIGLPSLTFFLPCRTCQLHQAHTLCGMKSRPCEPPAIYFFIPFVVFTARGTSLYTDYSRTFLCCQVFFDLK